MWRTQEKRQTLTALTLPPTAPTPLPVLLTASAAVPVPLTASATVPRAGLPTSPRRSTWTLRNASWAG